jgi:hypothetical protein
VEHFLDESRIGRSVPGQYAHELARVALGEHKRLVEALDHIDRARGYIDLSEMNAKRRHDLFDILTKPPVPEPEREEGDCPHMGNGDSWLNEWATQPARKFKFCPDCGASLRVGHDKISTKGET